MSWVEAIPVAQCRREGGTFVTVAGRELAVFVLDQPSQVVAIDNRCPHAGGNLSGGEVKGHIVQCPWHHWEFDLGTGVCTHSDLARVRCYPAEVRDGMVFVDLGNVDAAAPKECNRSTGL